MAKKRRVFEQGHARKLLVIVDESPEVEGALFYAAGRVSAHRRADRAALRHRARQPVLGRACARSSSRSRPTRRKALFRLFRRKLNNAGYDKVVIEEVIREGKMVEAILQQIDEDEDIAVLVLGASKEATGPGPLVSSLAAGATAGKFPIPITIVPGDLSLEEIQALA